MELGEIVNRLAELPALIAFCGERAEDLKRVWEKTKAEHEMIAANVYLLKKAECNATVNELSAMVKRDSAIYAKKMECIVAEANYRKADIETKKLDNEFTGLKVIARIKQMER